MNDRIIFRLQPILKQAIHARADEQDRTISAVIRRSLESDFLRRRALTRTVQTQSKTEVPIREK